MDSRKRFSGLETMSRERARLAKKDFDYGSPKLMSVRGAKAPPTHFQFNSNGVWNLAIYRANGRTVMGKKPAPECESLEASKKLRCVALAYIQETRKLLELLKTSAVSEERNEAFDAHGFEKWLQFLAEMSR